MSEWATCTELWLSNRTGQLKRIAADIDTRAPKFGPQQIGVAATPPTKSPEDGESQGNEVFPGVPPNTRTGLHWFAAFCSANDRNVARAQTAPSNCGANAIDVAANVLHRKQLVASVPHFPNNNGLEPCSGVICRCLIEATASHDNSELPWFLGLMAPTHDELDGPSVAHTFMMLGTPLATALMNTLTTQLRNRVAQLEPSALKRWEVVACRQVPWMVWAGPRHIHTGPHCLLVTT